MSRTPSSSSSAAARRQAWSEEKTADAPRHWSTTFDGIMLSKVNSHIYKQLSARDGLRDFFEQNCKYFITTNDDNDLDEFDTKHYELFKQYERAIEESLLGFAEQERLDPEEIYARCRSAVNEDPKAERSMQLLLGIVSFHKFVKLMRQKGKEIEAKESGYSDSSSTKRK